MESTAVQANTQNVRFRDTLVSGGNTGALQSMLGGDAFAMVFAQMLSGEGNPEDALLGQLQNIPAQEDESEEGQEAAMQMLAEMLMASNVSPEILAQLQSGDGQLINQAVMTVAQQVLNPQTQGQTARADMSAKGNAPQGMDKTAEENHAEAQILAASKNTQGEGARSDNMRFASDAQFKNAVLEAQRLLKASKDESKTEYMPVNIEHLQAEVDTGKYNVMAAKDTQLPMPSPKELLDQVQTGIQKNILNGKDSFVVKLKPEGLGEITVTMVQNNDKISLSILTSNSQVAKMLSGEIAGLRENLRPYNADVHEIVSASENTYASAQNNQQFTQDGQHQQFHEQQHAQQVHYYRDDDSVFDTADQPVQETLETGLNTYI